jgi:hypothetical protein
MSSLLLTVHLTPDEVRIIRSALSRDIVNYWEDDSMASEIEEWIQVYKTLQEVSDEKWSDWCYPNPELKKILDATNAVGQ